tara:strand:+ start:1232 stop:1912 length:681 start_codon:yes stop_codon:yes gene_type:complete
MTIDDLANKHNFKKDVDYWQHKQSGQWILKHNSIEKIANAENIKIQKIEPLYQSETSSRFLITMGKWVDDKCVEVVITTGEADKSNCTNAYITAMAEKRGKDRAILKLINAYEYGISSEEEMDDFKASKPKADNTIPVSPPAPPKINLQDQEVKFKEKVIDKFDGIPDDDDDDWDGEEICRFGKYREVAFKDIQDASWLVWVSQSSKVQWQRDLATKEVNRRANNV